MSDWHLPLTHRVKFEHLEQMGFWDLVTKPAPDECWTMTSQSPDVISLLRGLHQLAHHGNRHGRQDERAPRGAGTPPRPAAPA